MERAFEMGTPQTNRLLVVDDEEANRDLLSRRLKKAGFDVEMAASRAFSMSATSWIP